MSTRSLNKVLLIGNLTRDPELKYTPQGTAICSFGIATNREWTDSSGQKQEGAEFHRVVSWGKLAEICGSLLKKGRKIYIEGRLQTRSWKTQDGQDRQSTEVVMEEMIALDVPKGMNNGGDSYDNSGSYNSDEMAGSAMGDVFTATEPSKSSTKDVSDEIPF